MARSWCYDLSARDWQFGDVTARLRLARFDQRVKATAKEIKYGDY